MSPTLAMFGLGGTELLVVLLAVLVLFGARKIPDFAKGLGQGIKEFRKASREVQEELERATDEVNTPYPSPRRSTPRAVSEPPAEKDESEAHPDEAVEHSTPASGAPKA